MKQIDLSAHDVVREWTTWIPEWRGIREAYAANAKHFDDPMAAMKPVAMELRPIEAAEMNRYQAEAIGGPSRRGKKNSGPKLEKYTAAILSNCVRGVSNYSKSYEKSGSKVEISTGALLAKNGDPDLVDEVLDAIQELSLIEAGRLERFASQSDLSQPTTQP